MPYIRKTRDEYQIHQYVERTWEEVSCADTFREALELRKAYRENQPQYRVRIRKVRVPIEQETAQ